MAKRCRPEMRMVAEDAAINYLTNEFPPDVASATAAAVEFEFALRWNAEMRELIDRKDRRKVFMINERHMRELEQARTDTPPELSDSRGIGHLLDLLDELPIDWAWFVARRVREYVVFQWKRNCHTTNSWPGIAKAHNGG